MIGLFFGGKKFKTDFGNDFGNIELDANLEENHEWSVEATTNPVEYGAPVTDHVIENADKLRIRGFVSDATMDSLFSAKGFAQISGLFNGKKVASRTQAVFDTLKKLIKSRQPVTVYTKHDIYFDMIITDITIPRSPSNGEAIEFTVDFLHIRKVRTKKVEVPKGIGEKKDQKAGKSTQKKAETAKDAGKKEPEKKLVSGAKALKSGGIDFASENLKAKLGMK